MAFTKAKIVMASRMAVTGGLYCGATAVTAYPPEAQMDGVIRGGAEDETVYESKPDLIQKKKSNHLFSGIGHP